MLPYVVKRNFADVIKLRILKWEDYPGLSPWIQCNHKGPYKWRGRQEIQSDWMWEEFSQPLRLWNGGKELWVKQYNQPLEARKGKATNRVSPTASIKNNSANSLILVPYMPFQLLTLRTVRKYLVLF